MSYFHKPGKRFSPIFSRCISIELLDQRLAVPHFGGDICHHNSVAGWALTQRVPAQGQHVFVWDYALGQVITDGKVSSGRHQGRIGVQYLEDGSHYHVEPEQLLELDYMPSEFEAVRDCITLGGGDQEALFSHLLLIGAESAAGSILVRRVFLNDKCLFGAFVAKDTKIDGFVDDSPAAAAGLAVGDRIISVTFPVLDWSLLTEAKPERGNQHVLLGVVRAGVPVDVLLTGDSAGDLGVAHHKFPEISPKPGFKSEASGLQKGDRVATMTVPITSPDDLDPISKCLRPGSLVSISVLRSREACEMNQPPHLAMLCSLAATHMHMFLVPSCIRFTQATIKNAFMDGRSLLETATRLASRDIAKRDVEMIKVVKHAEDGNFYSLDNRRLAVFRLLEMLGKAKKIKARVIPKPEAEWRKKKDTRNDGVSVRVRGPENYVIGQSLATTTFPVRSILDNTSNAVVAMKVMRSTPQQFAQSEDDSDFIGLMQNLLHMDSDHE